VLVPFCSWSMGGCSCNSPTVSELTRSTATDSNLWNIGMNSLKQLYTLSMDVHSRYRTEAHQDVVARFNERFILSLGSCDSCLVIDDELNVLPSKC
jgi:hypothetical protein